MKRTYRHILSLTPGTGGMMLAVALPMFATPALAASPAEAPGVAVENGAPRKSKGDRLDLPTPGSRQPAAAEADDGIAPGEILWGNKKPMDPKVASIADNIAGPVQRQMEMEVPVKDDKFQLGDIQVRLNAASEASLSKERLLEIAKPLLREKTLELIKNAPDTGGGYVTVAALNAAGLNVRFDPGLVELQIEPTIEQRATGKVSGRTARSDVKSENLAKPALFAAYVNTRLGMDYATQSFFGPEGTLNGRAGFDGAMRWKEVVFESAATLDSTGGMTRGGSRFIYDRPDDVLRFSAGDVTPPKANFQGGSDLLGLTVEKTYQKLQPGADTHPTGSHSFRLERQSDVDVIVNGYVAQRLHLRPGDYDVADLPLTAGANDITLEITDDLGAKRKLQFSVFSGRSLLAPGISEWAVTGGITSTMSTTPPSAANLYSNFQYNLDTPTITGFYRRGVTADMTAEGHMQADPNSVMAGGGTSFQTKFGFWDLDGAVSYLAERAPGFSTRVNYDLSNIKGKNGVKRSFRASAEYRSLDFSTINVKETSNPTALNLISAYSQDLPWQLTGALSANYALARGSSADKIGLDASLSRSFGNDISTGLSLGFDHSFDGQITGNANVFKAMIRAGYRLDERSSIETSHDVQNGVSQLNYRHQEGSGIGSWNAQASLENKLPAGADSLDHVGLNASGSYTANRADLGLSHHTGLAGLNTAAIDQRTSFTAGSSFAFADGAYAMGRPISNGFAIVDTHHSLTDSTVNIGGSKDSKRASSDFLGPALISDVSPYSSTRISYDVDNIPTGYDLGTSAFDLFAPYKAGYRLTIGSDYTVTAFGTLVDSEGQPVTLITGTAFEEGNPNERKVTVFTNRAGRFNAQGLRPGHWIVEMATEPVTRYIVDIPKDTKGLVRLETLKPSGQTPATAPASQPGTAPTPPPPPPAPAPKPVPTGEAWATVQEPGDTP